MSNTLQLRRGNYCAFVVTVGGSGIPANYTKARCVARAAWNKALPAIFDIDDTSGLTIDHDAGTVSAVIGAGVTANVAAITQPQTIACELRLTDPNDATVSLPFELPMQLLPDLIA